MSLAELDGRTWAMKPDVLQRLLMARNNLQMASSVDTGDLEVPEVKAARLSATDSGQGEAVALIPLKGILMPQVSFLAALFGFGSSLLDFRSNLRTAMGDPDIGTVVIDVDSPGGLVDLIPEIGSEVRRARDTKKIIAVVNTLAASAAYWIAAQATEIVITPSGEAGSIGVFTEHQDISGALDQAGINPTLISAGKFKVETNPYQPLSASATEHLQEGVDDFYDMFTQAVADGRGATQTAVKGGFGQGRTLTAERSVQANLTDRVATLEEVLSELVGGARVTSVQASDKGGSIEAYSEEENLRRLDLALALGTNQPADPAGEKEAV